MLLKTVTVVLSAETLQALERAEKQTFELLLASEGLIKAEVKPANGCRKWSVRIAVEENETLQRCFD